MVTNLLPNECTCIRWAGDDRNCPRHGEEVCYVERDEYKRVEQAERELKVEFWRPR